MKDSDSNTITGNVLRNNPHYAVQLQPGCSLNTIEGNQFIGNRVPWCQAFDNGTDNLWNDLSLGNFWSDWTSPDSDSDGIVDEPYKIDGDASAQDLFPLAAPMGWPHISTQDITETNENKTYSVKYRASDSDTSSSSLVWGFASNASWLSFSDQQVVSGKPKASEIGKYWVNVSVSDATRIDFHNFTLEVRNVNEPPVILTVPVTTCYEHQAYSVKFTAKDPDPTKDVLTWSVETAATFLHMDAKTGTLSGTPGDYDVGAFAVNVRVSDGKSGVTYSNFTLTVIDVNDLPYINATIGDFSIPEDTPDSRIDLNDLFKDIDDELTFRSASSGSNITVSIAGSGIVTLTPKANWDGSQKITFYANDTHTELGNSITVTVNAVNDPPKDVTITFDVIAYVEGGAQPAWANATDPDLIYGDELTYTWSSNVTGTIGTGLAMNLSLPAGEHTITLNVTDRSGAWSSATKQITILPLKKDDTTGDKGFLANYWWVLLLIALLVIIIIVVIVIVVSKKKKDQEKEERLPEPSEAQPEPIHDTEKTAPPLPRRMRSDGQQQSPPPSEYIPASEPVPEPVPEPQPEPEPIPVPEPEPSQEPSPRPEPSPFETQAGPGPEIPPAINEPRIARKQLPPAEEGKRSGEKRALVDDLFSPLANQTESPKPMKKRPAVIVKCYKCNGDIPLESESGPQIITCPHCGTMSQLD